MQWFDVDKDGLRKVMARTGPAALVLELVQNAWDAPGSTTVDVTLTDHARRGRSTLAVIDDAPDGFIDLTHAFTSLEEGSLVLSGAQGGEEFLPVVSRGLCLPFTRCQGWTGHWEHA